MKKVLLITSLVLLSACSTDYSADLTKELPENEPQVSTLIDLPPIETREFQPVEITDESVDQLIDQIDESLGVQTISKDDIERGWYFANEGQKKIGTPDSWVKTEHQLGSFWMNPDAKTQFEQQATAQLCDLTGGRYHFSCIETELAECEHIAENKCDCPENTRWQSVEGCILVDVEGEFIEINQDDLKQGWYVGFRNQKKLHTPKNWQWVDWGEDSRWMSQ